MIEHPAATILNVQGARPDGIRVSHLLRQAGFRVTQARTGAEALGLAKERPDLILLDVELPDMSGVDVCRQIKKSLATACIPVLYRLPVRTRPERMNANLEGGADGYLIEPINRVELLTTVHALLRMRQAEDAADDWQGLFDALDDGVGLLSDSGTLLRANRALARLLTVPLDELIGREYRELVSDEGVPAAQPFFECGTPAQHLRVAEFWFGGRWLRREFKALAGARGQLVVLTDVTARKRAEQENERVAALQAQQAEHFRALLQATREGILSLDRAGRVTFVNPAACRLLGHEAAALVGQEFQALVQHSQADRTPALAQHSTILRALETGQAFRVDNEVFWRADGSCFAVEYLVTPLGGDAEGAVVSFRDIEEQHRLEERFRQSQKMEPMGRLTSGVTHDFNNLLTIISGYSEILLGRLKADDPSRDLILEIKNAQDRAAGLTRQLLAFSRKQTTHFQILDLNTVIADVNKLLCRLIGEDVEIVSRPAPALGCVRADIGQIEQVLLNLAVNARDAMQDGGTFTIETANVDLDDTYTRVYPELVPGPHVLLSISDSGSGMAPEVQAHMFEPFFTTKEPGKGTGLGLSTVASIIKEAGGHIRVFSEPGRGTTFKIYLPRVREEAPDHGHRNGCSA